MIVGIEVGGTFTDVVLAGPMGVVVHKTPSTPWDPNEAAIRGLSEIMDSEKVEGARVTELLHGSTIAANALIQRRGATVGLITTRGFADVIFNARASKRDIYDPFYKKPLPLILRKNILELNERLDARGMIVTALDAEEATKLADQLVNQGVTSLAICLLHSYANDVHERRVAEALARTHPDLLVTLSCDIAPEHREYERTSTTVISAYLRPAIDKYLAGFENRLQSVGIDRRPLIMQSSGGVVPVQTARRLAANMFLSGPAAAATGAAVIAKHCGLPDLITIDVGGTSSDVCLINGGVPQTTMKGTSEVNVEGLPLNVLMTDIVSIGAGGGSIAEVDAGGMLRVGPQSAGAKPGPACYDRGGTQFTVSDAMVVLGMLDAGVPLPGNINLSHDKACLAAKPLGLHFGLNEAEIADRVYRIAVANMARAIRQVSVRRGFDPRNYVLFPCGGVGPLIAVALAEEVGIAHIVIPPSPGVFSALGLTLADIKIDYVRSKGAVDVERITNADLISSLDELRERAIREFLELGYGREQLKFDFSVDARYAGQGYELRVPLIESNAKTEGVSMVANAFHDMHERQYGIRHQKKKIEIVSYRLIARVPRSSQAVGGRPAATIRPESSRDLVYLGDRSTFRVLDRGSIGCGERIQGPIILVEATTSTLVPSGWTASADEHSNLHLRCDR